MHRFKNHSAKNSQIPVSGDDTSYNDISSTDKSADTSTPFDSADYSQASVDNGDASQNVDSTGDKPWLKQSNGRQGGNKHGADAPAANVKNAILTVLIFAIAIVAVYIYFHDKDSGNSDGYSSYSSSSESRKLTEQEKTQKITDEASDAYRAISNQDFKVIQALDPLMQNPGNGGSSTEVTQAQVDKLKSEMAKMSEQINAFKKTKSYHKYSSVRKAYKEYRTADKNYLDAVNNFADSSIAYSKAMKNCNELNDWSSMNNDAAAYAAAKQKTITTCKTSAQALASSKDGPIKDYSAATIKRMDDAQKQLNGIKALGSSDEIFGNQTKFQKFEDLTQRLGTNLNPTPQFGDQNPVYKELMHGRPDKAMLKISSAIYDTDK
ncbi:hypothetical protein OZX67_08020 [Bifidobacterium sp. ESL0728]|uniref:hypothetical protein n=1 Tax=Bifidobacterium sp. ESL0728 TaxID=2983220 RepID=UPI0023FA0ED4|nr:hypothetical protein [Bifidobacterium sp. ESL0728]WEV58730.1 hypothetical protein OZX67_08020 [Bifidobacterium sp. ESL0728]